MKMTSSLVPFKEDPSHNFSSSSCRVREWKEEENFTRMFYCPSYWVNIIEITCNFSNWKGSAFFFFFCQVTGSVTSFLSILIPVVNGNLRPSPLFAPLPGTLIVSS